MSTKFWIASAGMCILTLTLVAAESLFAGTWKLNPSKSTLEGGLASAATVRIEPDGTGLKISVESVNAQRQPVNFMYQATLDGKSVKVTGSPTADETSTRRVNSHTYTATGMKNGKVVLAAFRQSVARLQQASGAAVTTLLKLMIDPATPPSTKARAADSVLVASRRYHLRCENHVDCLQTWYSFANRRTQDHHAAIWKPHGIKD